MPGTGHDGGELAGEVWSWEVVDAFLEIQIVAKEIGDAAAAAEDGPSRRPDLNHIATLQPERLSDMTTSPGICPLVAWLGRALETGYGGEFRGFRTRITYSWGEVPRRKADWAGALAGLTLPFRSRADCCFSNTHEM